MSDGQTPIFFPVTHPNLHVSCLADILAAAERSGVFIFQAFLKSFRVDTELQIHIA